MLILRLTSNDYSYLQILPPSLFEYGCARPWSVKMSIRQRRSTNRRSHSSQTCFVFTLALNLALALASGFGFGRRRRRPPLRRSFRCVASGGQSTRRRHSSQKLARARTTNGAQKTGWRPNDATLDLPYLSPHRSQTRRQKTPSVVASTSFCAVELLLSKGVRGELGLSTATAFPRIAYTTCTVPSRLQIDDSQWARSAI